MIRNKYRAGALLAIFLLLGIFSGCGKLSSFSDDPMKEDAGFVIYDLNGDKTALAEEAYTPSGIDTNEKISNLLIEMQKSTDESDMIRPIPDGITVQDYVFNAGTGRLTVSFNRSYLNLSGTQETLVRAAIVKTLLQIEEVESVEFLVDHTALVTPGGSTIGPMTEDSFVLGMSGDETSTQLATLTLYYPDASGEKLVKEEKKVSYDSNVPIGRVVMEYLQKTPTTGGAKPAYSKDTSLLSLSIADGICYVNLSSNFLSANTDVTREAAVYAIVNSLTEVPGVNKVLLSMDGKIINLNNQGDSILYVRNEAIVVPDSDEADADKTEESVN